MLIQRNTKGSKAGKSFLFLLFLSIIAGIIYGSVVFFENEKPEAVIKGEIQYLGEKSDIEFSIEDHKSGIRSIKLIILQKDKEYTLYEKQFPREKYTGKIGPEIEEKTVQLHLKKMGLQDGDAEVILSARDYSLRGYFSGNHTEIRKSIIIDTIPPKVRLIHAERYISAGGSGIVIYQIPGDVEAHGVDFSGHFHRGHLIGDGRDDVYIAYIALPFDATSISSSTILANDAAGNQTIVPFSPILKQVNRRFDKINVGDNFLKTKIPEFENHYPQMSGSMKDKYIYTNQVVRQENNQKIYDICQNPTEERFWKDRFQRMSGASKAGFADHRTYFYNGNEIDKQVHLGMDIASTRRAEVKAANKGKVVFADYLGIYGNMVILDHGQGVYSLYSHLSQIQVVPDDIIETGVVLGLTGKSGMAGGDHLHFSMLINGIFVTPKEWWDQQWIDVTIEDPIVGSRF